MRSDRHAAPPARLIPSAPIDRVPAANVYSDVLEGRDGHVPPAIRRASAVPASIVEQKGIDE